MAEVKMGGVFKVTVTEYERGWGQRTDENDTKYFTTIEEAEAYKAHWEEGGTPDYFWRARIEKI
jgi:hypothetical protein